MPWDNVQFQGRPDDALAPHKGCVWQRSIPKPELRANEQRHQVISSRLVGGRPFLHVLSPQPPKMGLHLAPPISKTSFLPRLAAGTEDRHSPAHRLV
jgi:ABC-2 type transport system ATP-binding protein